MCVLRVVDGAHNRRVQSAKAVDDLPSAQDSSLYVDGSEHLRLVPSLVEALLGVEEVEDSPLLEPELHVVHGRKRPVYLQALHDEVAEHRHGPVPVAGVGRRPEAPEPVSRASSGLGRM